MNSRLFTRGCRRTTSSMCPPSNTCGPWTVRSSGATSSWRPACAFSPDGPTESSSSSSVSARDVTGSPKSACRRRGQCRFQTGKLIETASVFIFRKHFVVVVVVCIRAIWFGFVRGGQGTEPPSCFCKIPAAFFSPLFKRGGLVLCGAHSANQAHSSQCQLIQECRWK